VKVFQIPFSDRINIVRQTCETGKLVPDRSYKINKILIIKLFDGLADSEARRLKKLFIRFITVEYWVLRWIVGGSIFSFALDSPTSDQRTNLHEVVVSFLQVT